MAVDRNQRAESIQTEKRKKKQRTGNNPKSRQEEGPVRSLQRTLGNQVAKKLVESGELQSNLKASHFDDRSERELRQIAKAVGRIPDPKYTVNTDKTIQRKTKTDTLRRENRRSKGDRSPDPTADICPRCIRRYRAGELLTCAESEQSLKGGTEPTNQQSVAEAAIQPKLTAISGTRPIRQLGTPLIQPKHRVTQHDRYEREADQVAESVLWPPGSVVSATDMGDDSASVDRLVPLDRAPFVRETPLHLSLAEGDQQRTKRESNSTASPSLQSLVGGVERELRAENRRGRPLPESIRSVLEPQFGFDFSTVRVHSGRQAAELTTRFNAQAFTYGRHIYFGRGNYDVTTASGRDLLTHELTHTVQQQSISRSRRGDSARRTTSLRRSADTPEAAFIGDYVSDIATIIGPTQLAGPAVQRRPLPDLDGTRLGSIAFERPGGGLFRGGVRVEAELVPPGEQPGRFEGYADRLPAMARCWRENALCAVFEDDSGRFHAVRTNWPARDPRVEGLHLSPSEGIRGLQWIHVTDEAAARAAEAKEGGPRRSWSDRVRQVKRWHDAWKEGNVPSDFQPEGGERTRETLRDTIERAYVSLLAEALGIGTHEIHIARGSDNWEPRRINFDLTLDTKARGGIRSLPDDRETDDLPEPTVVIGPETIYNETRISAVATAIHEVTHYAHGQRTVELWNRWRRSRTDRTFVEWLRRRRRREADDLEEILAKEEARGGFGNTEALARTEAFIATYHRFELSNTPTRFESIDTLPPYWNNSDPVVKMTVIRRLTTYVDSLPGPYREDFRRHLNEKLEKAETGRLLRSHVPFWEQFARDVLPLNSP